MRYCEKCRSVEGGCTWGSLLTGAGFRGFVAVNEIVDHFPEQAFGLAPIIRFRQYIHHQTVADAVWTHTLVAAKKQILCPTEKAQTLFDSVLALRLGPALQQDLVGKQTKTTVSERVSKYTNATLVSGTYGNRDHIGFASFQCRVLDAEIEHGEKQIFEALRSEFGNAKGV